MTQAFTEEDVQRLIAVLQRDCDVCSGRLGCREHWSQARAALVVLAEDGRLLPADAKCDLLLADGTHRYWSTHCRHGDHDSCSAEVIVGQSPGDPDRTAVIARKPACCKHCGSPCCCAECKASGRH